jgi:hypothetical protein
MMRSVSERWGDGLLFRDSSRVQHPSGHNGGRSASQAPVALQRPKRGPESDAAQWRASIGQVGVHERSHTGKSVSGGRKVISNFSILLQAHLLQSHRS